MVCWRQVELNKRQKRRFASNTETWRHTRKVLRFLFAGDTWNKRMMRVCPTDKPITHRRRHTHSAPPFGRLTSWPLPPSACARTSSDSPTEVLPAKTNSPSTEKADSPLTWGDKVSCLLLSRFTSILTTLETYLHLGPAGAWSLRLWHDYPWPPQSDVVTPSEKKGLPCQMRLQNGPPLSMRYSRAAQQKQRNADYHGSLLQQIVFCS